MYSLLAIAALVAVAFAVPDNDCDYYEYQSGGSCIRRVPCRTYQWAVCLLIRSFLHYCLTRSVQETLSTPTTDAVCKYMSRCPDDHFYNVVPTPTSDGTCLPLTVCHELTETAAPTATSDRTCV